MTAGRHRAEEDLAAGRLWQARDRVQGLLRPGCSDSEVLDLAARILFAMGDHPRAGAHWYLTEVSHGDAEVAFEAMRVRYGVESGSVGNRALAEALPVRAAVDAYPPRVQDRLADLAAAVQTPGRPWPPWGGRLAGERAGGEQHAGEFGIEPPRQPRMTMSFLVVVLLGAWAAGLAAIVVFIVLWLAGAF